MKQALYILPIIFCFAFQLQAQEDYVIIRDSAFARGIAQHFPDILDDTQTMLDTVKAKQVKGTFSLEDFSNVRYIDELPYFHSLGLFRITGSQVDSVPDISNLKSLYNLSLGRNKITHVPDLSSLTSLKALYLYDNEIDTIIGIEEHPKLEIVIIGSNRLNYLPDITTMPNIDSLNLLYNYITWEDIEPFAESVDFQNTAIVFPQHVATDDTTVTLLEYDDYEFSLPIDQDVEFVYFSIIKNDSIEIYQNSNSRSYTFNNVQPTASGNYRATLKTELTEFEGKSIESGELTLQVISCDDNILSYEVETYRGYPTSGAILQNVSTQFPDKSYQYFFTDGDNEYEVILDNKAELPAGIYDLKISADNGCVSIRGNAVEVLPYQEVSNVYFDVNKECNELSFTLNSYNLTNEGEEFEFYLSNQERQYTVSTESTQTVDEGIYNLHITDNDLYDSLLVKDINILKPNDCNKFFSPNGDGNNDVMYLPYAGTISIIDRKGNEVVTLTGPAYWSGNDTEGNVLPIGVYGIVTPDNKRYSITIIK